MPSAMRIRALSSGVERRAFNPCVDGSIPSEPTNFKEYCMKLAWCTDIHLNFLNDHKREEFYDKFMTDDIDAVLISGDIAEATNIDYIMIEMGNYIKKPIYFVCGNHDFYEGSVSSVRLSLDEAQKKCPYLHYLTMGHYNVIHLYGVNVLYSFGVMVIGIDGWADTRYGDVWKSHVALNDEHYIKDLRDHQTEYNYGTPGKVGKWDKRKELADSDAQSLKNGITSALESRDELNPLMDQCFYDGSTIKKIIILTHIPPFPEASKHRGVQSDDNYLPFYASKATGDVLMELATKYPDVDFLCLCGHTHGAADFQALPNLRVKAGECEYRYPCIQEIIEI